MPASIAHRLLSSSIAGTAFAILAGFVPCVGQAQAAQATADTLVVTLAVDTARFLSATSVLELALSRPLTASDGELATVIGGTDVASLLAARMPHHRHRELWRCKGQGEGMQSAAQVARVLLGHGGDEVCCACERKGG